MKLRQILVVDDSDADRFLAKEIIEEFDATIEVIEALDGKEALEVLADGSVRPDVILLDINMPVMDGHEFLQVYGQTKAPSSTVIMLSSSREQKDIERTRKYDFVADYLVKPLSTEHLKKLANA